MLPCSQPPLTSGGPASQRSKSDPLVGYQSPRYQSEAFAFLFYHRFASISTKHDFGALSLAHASSASLQVGDTSVHVDAYTLDPYFKFREPQVTKLACVKSRLSAHFRLTIAVQQPCSSHRGSLFIRPQPIRSRIESSNLYMGYSVHTLKPLWDCGVEEACTRRA